MVVGYIINNMGRFAFKKEDYILYILNHLEPEKSDLWRMNKIAFLVEFAYLYLKDAPLSDSEYAAITHGPVINDYSLLLKMMEAKDLIKQDGFNIRVVTDKRIEVPQEIADFINKRIAKYSPMTNGELKAITHSTDSYKITTKNEKLYGEIINKSLAVLETMFEENGEAETEIPEADLPKVKKEDLVPYEF